jgi:cell volume regulation protein A
METAFIIPLFVAAAIALAGILVSPLSSRLGMPVLLFFLAVGMLAGEDGPGNIIFDDIGLSFVVGNLALAVILLDGGMRTDVRHFRVGLRPALILASLGVVVTAVVVGVAAAWLLGVPLLVGMLIASIVSSTDAAVVFSMLQGGGLSLNDRVKATLEIESGSNDPMAIFLTLLFIGLIENPDSTWLSALMMLVKQFGIGAIAGYVGGHLVARVLRKVVLVTAMYPLLVVFAGLVLFSVTNMAGGSGFLAVYLMGIVLSARPTSQMDNILQIHDGLAWLAQLALFLLLGLLVTPSELLGVLPEALLISVALIFVARPLSTVLSLLPFGFSRAEHIFMGWVGLRGAVPVVLALFPLMAGLEDARTIFQITFVVVIVSLLLQGSTLAPLARRLKLEVPPTPEPELRVPLQLAATGSHELWLFQLKGKRWQKPVEITDIHLPAPSRIVMYFRAGEMFEPRRGLFAQEGDVVAVFVHHDHAGDVGHILGWDEPPERLTDRRFFGEFTVNGAAMLRDVQAMYGVEISGFEPTQTLSDCFARASRGHPVVGDRVLKVGLKLSR